MIDYQSYAYLAGSLLVLISALAALWQLHRYRHPPKHRAAAPSQPLHLVALFNAAVLYELSLWRLAKWGR